MAEKSKKIKTISSKDDLIKSLLFRIERLEKNLLKIDPKDKSSNIEKDFMDGAGTKF